MDVTLLNTSVFDIPSSRRVGAIVHDGTTDMRLWPGPGWDRELNHAYGPGLQEMLDTQRTQMGVRELPELGVARIHPGRLHCDLLAWVATRKPQPGSERQPAPAAEELEKAVLSVLAFVAERDVERVAFPALGDGPGELTAAERLAIIVRAAHRFEDERFAAGRPPVVEEVLVCEPSTRAISEARRKVSNLASAAAPERPVVEEKPKPAKKRRVATGGTRKKAAPAKLDDGAVSRARVSADPYDMTRTYGEGDWFVHPKFGVGCVQMVTPEGAIEVLFEDGAKKKMIHGRA